MKVWSGTPPHRTNISPRSGITTIGDIVGKIVMVKPDTIVIETSDDRVRTIFDG